MALPGRLVQFTQYSFLSQIGTVLRLIGDMSISIMPPISCYQYLHLSLENYPTPYP